MAPIDQYRRAGSPPNFRVITIVGTVHAGKTTLGNNLATHLDDVHDIRTLHISCGHLFRALGLIGGILTTPRSAPDVAQILRYAQEHRFKIVHGRPYLDDQEINALDLDAAAERSSILGRNEDAQNFVLDQLRWVGDQWCLEGGILVIDGRGLQVDFPGALHIALTVSPEIATGRGDGTPVRRRNDLDRSHPRGLPGDVALATMADVTVKTDQLDPDDVLRAVLPAVHARFGLANCPQG